MRCVRTFNTPSLVLSCLALLVAIGGGSAAAAVLITSNSQVAKGTISGHHPPSGDHANIIGGSIGAADLSGALQATLTLHCPAGLGAYAGVCFETGERAASTYPAALEACTAIGRRLPSPSELALVFQASGAPQGAQWVDSFTFDSGLNLVGHALSDDASRRLGFSQSAGGLLPYRCVASPVN